MIKTFDLPLILAKIVTSSEEAVIVSGPYAWSAKPYATNAGWMLEFHKEFFHDRDSGVALIHSSIKDMWFTLYKKLYVTNSSTLTISVPLTSKQIEYQAGVMAYRTELGPTLAYLYTGSGTLGKDYKKKRKSSFSTTQTPRNDLASVAAVTALLSQDFDSSSSSGSSFDGGGGGDSGGGGASGDW